MDYLIRKGKQLSYLLRHDLSAFSSGLIDENGWRSVNEIILNYGFTPALLQEIVASNNKQRYEFNSDCTKIRARQGHSIHVNVELKIATNITESNPYLWHGTSDRFIEDIKERGLIAGARLYVHLSGDEKTAQEVGRRHGGRQVCIICIDAYKMILDGKTIYISNNGVYNVDKVEPQYFIDIKYISQ